MTFKRSLMFNERASAKKTSHHSHRACDCFVPFRMMKNGVGFFVLLILYSTFYQTFHVGKDKLLATGNNQQLRYQLNCSDVILQGSFGNNASSSFQWIQTSTKPSFRMSVHPTQDDIWVSGSIAKGGCWECPSVRMVQEAMERFPDAYFIDFGSNIGMYSLTVAAMGRMAFAFEPMHRNYMHICRSMQENNFSENLQVFSVAVSDQVKKVTLLTIPRNIGATSIHTMIENRNATAPLMEGRDFAWAIPLNLIHHVFPKNQPVVIKMDIEKAEIGAMVGAMEFLKDADIKLLLMETWKSACFQSPNITDTIFDLLQRKGLHPMENRGGKNFPLNDVWREWKPFQKSGPDVFMDIVWEHSDQYSKIS